MLLKSIGEAIYPVLISKRPNLLFLLLLAAAGLGAALARPPAIIASDQEQPRSDHASVTPQAAITVGQTFIAVHNGLSAIEVLAVVPPATEVSTSLTLMLSEASGESIASGSFAGFRHNAVLRLSFPPQPLSAGRTYTLLVTGPPTNTAAVWAYSLDGYHAGTLLTDNKPVAGDLRFKTEYTYMPADILHDFAANLGRVAGQVIPLWLVLFAPGLLLLNWLMPASYRPISTWTRWGLALGLSLAISPLAWLWLTILGGQWSTLTLRLVYGSTGLIVIGHILKPQIVAALKLTFGASRALTTAAASALPPRRQYTLPATHFAAMSLIMLITLASRLAAMRDLAFPAWVDSPHHFTITRLMAESGRIPASYAPLLPIDRFSYHFGFHTLAVAFQALDVFALPLDTTHSAAISPARLLFLSQILNSLTPLAIYAAAASLNLRPRAALVAALLSGVVSFFPGYYLSWGRSTQLAGILIMAPALGQLWRLVAPGPDRYARPPAKLIMMTAVLATGLLLTHYRVFIFFAIFSLSALAAGGKNGWRWALATSGLGLALSLPWVLRLGTQNVLPVMITPQRLAALPGYNAFPTNYFQSTLERGWLVVAILSAIWNTVRPHRNRPLLAITGWTIVTFALLNIGPGTWVVNNNSWAITIFVPASLSAGWGLDRWLALATVDLRQRRLLWLLAGTTMLITAASLAAYAGARGWQTQSSLLNPTTVLAHTGDTAALAWISKNVPDDAVFLINGWLWQTNAWAGADGGAWIWPLTGRRTTLPPIDYMEQRRWMLAVNHFNARAARLASMPPAEVRRLLRAAGVTHIYVGARNGTLRPEMFAGNEADYRLVYTNGDAWIFALK